MKFAHLADVHIESWRDPKLKQLSTQAFVKAVSICLDKELDFVLISGDLFNTALPGIDSVKIVVRQLRKLKNSKIAVYCIPGSHDFSPSGKTMLDVLEEAGLLTNVVKGEIIEEKLRLNFTVDKRTGAKITGMLGKRGMLDRVYYENLDKTNLEEEDGFKIFMFHTCLSEFKPKDYQAMDGNPLSLLPKNFDYYAGGHVHYVFEKDEEEYGKIVYPGPLFPANFAELEKLGHGGFYVFDENDLEYQDVVIKNVFSIKIDAEHKNAERIMQEIKEKAKSQEFINTIILIRVAGKMVGNPSDIDFKEVFNAFYNKSAFFVMKNTTKLVGDTFEQVKVTAGSTEEVEEKIIAENAGQVKVDFDETAIAKTLLKALDSEKHEGEKQYEYEERIKQEADEVVGNSSV